MTKERVPKQSIFSWINRRERGIGHAKPAVPRSFESLLWKRIYRSTKVDEGSSTFGGIFGLRYSPGGRVLVAACEERCLVFKDPLTEKVIEVVKAHSDCCNNVSFVDDRMLASCSDDCTIAVWDIRNLSEYVFRLEGHDNWVKNVEVHKPTKQIVSSGFDGTVCLWNLTDSDDQGSIKSRELLTVDDLIRMRLSPNGDSMYISSVAFSEAIAIHQLELDALKQDIGFIESIGDYHGMRTKNAEIISLPHDQNLPIGKRNHMDLIWDCGARIVRGLGKESPCQSIDVHPHNCAVLLHRIGASQKKTTVHNTRTRYGLCTDENPTAAAILRGSTTNVLREQFSGSGDFIEEVCFSPCGRLIATPSGYGIAVATYDENSSDYETHLLHKIDSASKKGKTNSVMVTQSKRQRTDETSCVEVEPSLLQVVKYSFGHRSPVLSTAFSPTHLQLVSGSEDGVILFHNPIL